jgi:predicted anti-sigma-YlaC factor YlaD
MHAACDRARGWATADVDGELSAFERVLLNAHLTDCASCREFHAAVEGFTDMLRAAPLERPARAIDIGRVGRRLRIPLRVAPAVAAMAVTVVGLGSILASSDLRSSSVGGPIGAKSEFAGLDTINLATAQARATMTRNTARPVRTLQARSARSLRGGPVIRER